MPNAPTGAVALPHPRWLPQASRTLSNAPMMRSRIRVRRTIAHHAGADPVGRWPRDPVSQPWAMRGGYVRARPGLYGESHLARSWPASSDGLDEDERAMLS